VTDIAWMLEVLRDSILAPRLGSAHPGSELRVRNAIAAVARAGNPSAARHV
jgi:ATP-dependent helicase HrpA